MLMMKLRSKNRNRAEMWIPLEGTPGTEMYAVYGTVPASALEVVQAKGAGEEFRRSAPGLFFLFKIKVESEPLPWAFTAGFHSYETPDSLQDQLEVLVPDLSLPKNTDQDLEQQLSSFMPLAKAFPELERIEPGKSMRVRFRLGLSYEARIQAQHNLPLWS